MARPKIAIDWKKVDNMLRAGCSGAGIAGLLGIHPDTLYDACQRDHNSGFSDYSQAKKAEGQSLVRSTMYDMAIRERNPTMLIFLGKTDLGMAETQKIEHNIDRVLIEIINPTKPVTSEDDISEDI